MKFLLRAQVARASQMLLVSFRRVGRLGFGRAGGLAAMRRKFPARAVSPTRLALSLVIGSLLIGTGVAFLTQARLGLSPYDVLVSGLQPRIGVSFGQTVMVVSAVLFAIAAILGQRPSRWGILFVLANGFAIDAVSGSINSPDSMLGRMTFVFAALVTISTGISLVVHSGSTGGSFELLMKAGEVRGLDRRVVRTSLEVGVLTLGIALGGSFGPATVIIALGVGPLLGVIGQGLADHQTGRTVRMIEDSPESRHPSSMTRRHVRSRS